MSSLTFSNVCKRYSDSGVLAVCDFSCEIADGEFVVVVGASGSGKTTLLRLVAGLESVTSGEIFLGDRRVNDLKAGERGVAMVFQRYSLLPHYNVYKNLGLGLRANGVPKNEADARIREAADLLGLADLLDRKPATLSGGQRQRVALGRAVVTRPKIFLLDEPLSNLDARLRTEMRGEIMRLHRTLKTTFVYVTHDQVEAMTMADRMIVMDGGRIQQFAPPRTIYNNPKTLFVASFIGSPKINLLPCTISSVHEALPCTTSCDDEAFLGNVKAAPCLKDGCAVLEIFGVEYNIPYPLVCGKATLAVRPEDISLSKHDDGCNIEFDAIVENIEQLGSQTLIYTRTITSDQCQTTDSPSNPQPANGHAISGDVSADGVSMSGDLSADGVFASGDVLRGENQVGGNVEQTLKKFGGSCGVVLAVEPNYDLECGNRITLYLNANKLHFFDADGKSCQKAFDADGKSCQKAFDADGKSCQ